ncbi:c6 zinc finger domain-containing [Fusarium sporotrichioides]|uniref:C6 zinc finger domain-containing n=1 Tax=Fusarium sporotrichioides TaxID=5514 RepID=A0A395SIA7_FUSSP|nr:c6 zinc finger domain-containing [Fusarium sporotrichioides]
MCRSQEFADDGEGSEVSVKRLAQRLSRLEELMERLAEHPALANPTTVMEPKSGIAATTLQPDFIERSSDQPYAASLEPLISNQTPTGQGLLSTSPPHYASNALYGLFPSQADVSTIVEASAGPSYLTALFYCQADIFEGRPAPPSSFSSIPEYNSHPICLAKWLLQLAICMQQLSPHFDVAKLSKPEPIGKTMIRIVNHVEDHVTSVDQYAVTSLGLECLLLMGYWHSHAGNLRKSWLIFRRALSVCQLLGIDHQKPVSLFTTQPRLVSKSAAAPDPEMLRYRAISNDRHLSLLLGIGMAQLDNDFASKAATNRNTDSEKLEKLHAMIAARIIQRNDMTLAEAYTYTREASLDMRAGAAILGEGWWEQPVLDPNAALKDLFPLVSRLLLQSNHHLLLLFLHTPYMLNQTVDQGGYSRLVCIESSRAVLTRFNAWRRVNHSAYSCRHIDYAALLTAMTLLISYSVRHESNDIQPSIMQEDKQLVLMVKERMCNVISLSNDAPLKESSVIIEQLLGIMEAGSPEALDMGAEIHPSIDLHIPHFGTVTISRPATISKSASQDGKTSLEDTLESSSARSFIADSDKDDEDAERTSRNPSAQIHFQPGPQDFPPDLTPLTQATEWPLQGVDATYWSLFERSLENSDNQSL